MKRTLTLWVLLAMTLASASAADNSTPQSAEQLAKRPDVTRALDWFDRNAAWITEQQIRITEMPAPTFAERQRALLMKKMLEGTGFKLRTDELGNVIAERQGSAVRVGRAERDVILVSAHLDTVYPPGTDVRVRRDAGRLIGAGISDNSCGLVSLVALAQALHAARIHPRATIVLAANVGEEGEGNLRGMRKLMEVYRGRVRAVIAIDGASIEHVTALALASRRFEISVSGPGGHSWSDFGMPNPIHAISRGVARFVRVRVPSDPRTSFNVGMIEGGTSVNSIPHDASVKVDLRSESDSELARLEAALREAMQAGVDEETAASRERGIANGVARLELKVKLLGSRPGGELPSEAPLLNAVRSADRFLGNRSKIERSSTDANIPLSLGVPAVALGGGGRGGGAHSLNEWYEPAGRELGLKRILLTLLGVAGVGE